MNSLYAKTIQYPPAFDVKENAKELIIEVVSCMCDNLSYLHFKRDTSSLSYKNHHCSLAFSNMQAKCLREELIWALEDNDIEAAVRMINSGTVKVYNIKVRG